MWNKLTLISLLLLFSLALSAQVNGDLQQIGNQKILQVWGSHYERGYAQGYLLSPQIMEVFNDLYWTMFCYSSTDFYNQLLTYYQQHFTTPERMYWEVQGMAEGMAASGQSLYHPGLGRDLGLDDLLLLNTMHDMIALGAKPASKPGFGCASLSSWGVATAADSILASGSVITRFLDASPNSALIGNPLMIVHHPSESTEQKWLGLSYPGFVNPPTVISEHMLYASMNTGSDHYAPNPTNLSPILWDMRKGVEMPDFNADGTTNAYDIHSAIASGEHLSGSIIHSLHEAAGAVSSLVTETKSGTTQYRSYNQNGNLPTHHLAATNHFRLISGAICCDRYANLQDSLYANPHITAKRQWQVMSGAAGLESTLSAIQFVPSTGYLLWAAASLSQPAYQLPALPFDVNTLFAYSVANSDEHLPAAAPELSIYPNPWVVGQALNISASKAVAKLEIYNLKGQQVLVTHVAAKTGEISFDLQGYPLPTGIYFLKASFHDSSTLVRRFVAR